MKPKAVSLSGQRSRAAFSLIELLTVIAIIAILAGLLLTTSGFVQEKAGNARAQSEIQALTSALEAYKSDYGTYPETTETGATSTKVLLDALNRTPAGASPPTKVYYQIPANMLPGTASTSSYADRLRDATALQDPFGNPYNYEFKSDPAWKNDQRSGNGFFNLWSYGKKGNSPANQDPVKWIKNW